MVRATWVFAILTSINRKFNVLLLTSVEYSDTFVHFLLPHEEEDKLPLMLSHLRNNASLLGIRDLQLRPTPLEEVFMTITKKAELENAEVRSKIFVSISFPMATNSTNDTCRREKEDLRIWYSRRSRSPSKFQLELITLKVQVRILS